MNPAPPILETCDSTTPIPTAGAAVAGQTGYLAAYREWLRVGAPGQSPSSIAYGVFLSDNVMEVAEIDGAFRNAHGVTNWNFYRPEFYDRMMHIRRAAHEQGVDPDAAAMTFTSEFYGSAKHAITYLKEHSDGTCHDSK